MKKPSPPKRNWLFVAGVGGAVLGYVFVLFLPGQQATAELRAELVKKRDFVVASAPAGAQIVEVERELKRTKDFVDAWSAAAPSEARIAHVFVQITESAEQAGAEIVRFEPQPIVKLELLQRAPVEMACEGTFAQIHAFLRKLEAIEADFWIVRLECAPLASDTLRLRCELSLAFFADQPKISD